MGYSYDIVADILTSDGITHRETETLHFSEEKTKEEALKGYQNLLVLKGKYSEEDMKNSQFVVRAYRS